MISFSQSLDDEVRPDWNNQFISAHLRHSVWEDVLETKRNGIIMIDITSKTSQAFSLSFYDFYLHNMHYLPPPLSLSLVVLIDGLQAPNISGKDDLHHQICHKSYESKTKLGIHEGSSLMFLNGVFCFSKIMSLTYLSLSQLYKHVVQIVEKFIKKVKQTHLCSVFTQNLLLKLK